LIAILNISEKYGKGKQRYRVQINKKFITEFDHNFEDGLAVCLRKASEAVEKIPTVEL